MRGIKKNDMVKVMAGKDRGKTGKVISAHPSTQRVLVEGVNMVKRHQRRRSQESPGGILSVESPIHVSNLMVICKGCNRPTRVAVAVLADGTKSRTCKKCKEVID